MSIKNKTTWQGRILATLTFFTRLPLWRLCDIPRECYERVVPLWPLAGWVTGGTMAAVYALAIQVLPLEVSVLLALVSRVLLTGALHEDGFADFCDGFGGGTSRQRTLEIMKDSHIGTYGVLGLLLYYLLLYSLLCHLLPNVACAPLLLVATDTIAKFLSSTIIIRLPYARTASEAKNKLVYAPYPWAERVLSLLIAFAPCAAVCLIYADATHYVNAMILAVICAAMTVGMLFRWMRKRIGGYTGDCCGATFLIAELVMYIVFSVNC